jgi:hypothetical protein
VGSGATGLRNQKRTSEEQPRRRLGRHETACYIVAAVVELLYIGIIIWLAIPMGLASLWPMALVLIVAVLVAYSYRLSEDPTIDDGPFTKHLGSLAPGATTTVRTYQKPSKACALLKHVLVATMEYNPALKTMFAQASSLFLQNSFEQTLGNALRSYGLQIDSESQSYLDSFRSLTGTEDEWLAEASEGLSRSLAKSGLPTSADIISLLYYAYVGNQAGVNNLMMRIVANPSQTTDLAGILLGTFPFAQSLSGQEKAKETANLALVIRFLGISGWSSIRSRYQSFREVFTWSENLATFCARHELAPKGFCIGFPWLFGLLKDEMDIRSYDQAQMVCSEIVRRSGLGHRRPQAVKAASLAALALFFESRGDPWLSDTYQDAARNDLALQMLHQFIIRNEKAKRKQEIVSLRTAIEEVLSKRAMKYAYVEDLRSSLLAGYMPKRLTELLSVRTTTILRIIKGDKNTSRVLGELQSSLHDFFDAELSENVVLQLLRMQVISAYLLTTPSRKPVISEIVGESMPKACKDLTRRDAKFREMLMMEKGAGRYTRIGIVPVGMSFEDFSSRFSKVFERAVQKYCKENPGKGLEPKDFSAHIIRIFPVEDTFKSVAGSGAETVVGDLASRIRGLLLSSASDEANLTLIAAARTGEAGKIALKKVVVAIFNRYSSIGLLLKDKMDSLIATRKQLKTAFETRAFDNILLARMNCETVTQLAQNTYTLAPTQKDKKTIKQRITRHVSGILDELGTRMTKQEREALASEIFEKLYGVGLVLAGPRAKP